MNNKILLKILDVYEIAATDEEYLRLYEDYAPAQEKLRELLIQLPSDQRSTFENYLLVSTELHHWLMSLAIRFCACANEKDVI